jgi:nicotinamide mononucleotide transporter
MSDLSNAIPWFKQHFIEVLAVITGLLYVVYTIRENILLWLFGIISSGLYIWVFYKAGIYAYSLLYLYYVLIGFYGWYNWSVKHEESEKKGLNLRIHKASPRMLWFYMLITGIITLPIFYLLEKIVGSDLALADAFLTSAGIVATWMLTQKVLEQWLFWIVIDLLSIFLMIYKGLYPSAVLFLVYSLLAVKGFIAWKKEVKSE